MTPLIGQQINDEPRIAGSTRVGRARQPRGGAALTAHRLPVPLDLVDDPRRHRLTGQVRITPATRGGRGIEISRVGATPTKIEALVDTDAHTVLRQQIAK